MFVLVHPHFSHPQGVSLHGHAQVGHVGLVVPLDVGNLGAGNHLDAASTRPDLSEDRVKRRSNAVACSEEQIAKHKCSCPTEMQRQFDLMELRQRDPVESNKKIAKK